jgi:hypothetical protein
LKLYEQALYCALSLYLVSLISIKIDYIYKYKIIILLIGIFTVGSMLKEAPVVKKNLFLNHHNLKLISNNDENENYYSWFRYQNFNPYIKTMNKVRPFSLYFNKDYRVALEALYQRKIDVQRLHWIGNLRYDKKYKRKKYYTLGIIEYKNKYVNKELATLLALDKENYKFKFYNNWIIDNNSYSSTGYKSVNPSNPLSKKNTDDTIVLNQEPNFLSSNDNNNIKENNVKIKYKSSNQFILEVEAKEKSILFIPESFNKYWNISINNQKVQNLKAFLAFRGVAVSEGKNLIKMKFTYLPFYYGSIISILFLIVCTISRKVFIKVIK